jgi:hypothetical protein
MVITYHRGASSPTIWLAHNTIPVMAGLVPAIPIRKALHP